VGRAYLFCRGIGWGLLGQCQRGWWLGWDVMNTLYGYRTSGLVRKPTIDHQAGETRDGIWGNKI